MKITKKSTKAIEKALVEIGFTKSSGRYFTHPETEYFVEFPKPPLAIGNMPIKEWATQNNKAGKLQLLTPTHSVMDRLAGYFHWNDKQNLDQALMIAKSTRSKSKKLRGGPKTKKKLKSLKFSEQDSPMTKNKKTEHSGAKNGAGH